MKYFLLFFLNVFLLTTSFAQLKFSKEVQIIVQAIANANKYESRYVGFAGSESEQYKRMLHLKKVATKEELLTLTKNDRAAVRIYSYLALLQVYPAEAEKVYERLKKDYTKVFTLEGCVGGRSTVGNIVYRFSPQ